MHELNFKGKMFCVVSKNNQNKLVVAGIENGGKVLIQAFDLKTFEALESFELKAGNNILSIASTTEGVVYLTDGYSLYVCKMGEEDSQKNIERRRGIYY